MMHFLLFYKMDFCERHPRLMAACIIIAGAVGLYVIGDAP